MPRSRTEPAKARSEAPTAMVEPTPEPAPAASTCPHGAGADCPLCALDSMDATPAPADEVLPEPAVEPEPEPSVVTLTDDEWDRLAAEYGDADLPLADGEEVVGQRLDDDGDLVVVTSFGRKLGISPDGWIVVLMGPPLDREAASVPKPPRKSWKDPR